VCRKSVMPGAFLKGNSSFLAANEFSVDQLSRPWNVLGQANLRELADQPFIVSEKECAYYKLKNIVILTIKATIIPTTFQYTGVENDTSFLYSGKLDLLAQNVNGKLPTQLVFVLDSFLAAGPFHYQNSLTVVDRKTSVFFDITEDQQIGTLHINGVLNATHLILTLPSGFLPHHRYTVSASLAYSSIT